VFIVSFDVDYHDLMLVRFIVLNKDETKVEMCN